jgi:(S)-3,5-dihydroxyphenylglycine transaminase
VGITGAASLLDITVVTVEEHEDGFRCADLDLVINAERARGRHPRAFYLVPDHSNPAGTTMPVETRRELLDLAARRDLLIVEDSPYRMVSPEPHLPTLKSLDRQHRVIHLGSFSKTAFPGARVGFAVADQTVTDAAGHAGLLADEFAKIKSMVTVNTPPLSQAVIAGMLLGCEGRISELNTQQAAYYAHAMRSTLRQLDLCFPACKRKAQGVRWNEPDGGFFLTMRVPFRADNAALARSAEDFGVIWTPMSYFYPQGGGDYSLRLSVSYLSEDDITNGITRLASFIETEINRGI